MQERSLVTILKNSGLALLVLMPLLLVVMFMTNEWSILLPLAVLVLLAPVIARDDAQALLLILVLRPMVDIFGERHLVEVLNIPLNLSSVISVVVILWAALRLLGRRSIVWRKPLFWPLLLVLGVMGSSLATTISPAATVREIVRFASFFLLYLLATECFRNTKDLRQLVKALALSAVLPVTVALTQFVTQSGLSFGDLTNRVYGTFGHPNVLAMYVMLVVAALVGTPSLFGVVWRRRMIVGIAVLIGVLLLTYTRGAWLGMTIIFLFVGLVSHRRALAWASLAVVVLLLFGPTLQRVALNSLNIDLARVPVLERVLDRSSDDSSIDWRIALWKDMRRKIDEQPLLGHGLGSFSILRERQISNPVEGTEAHNDYLRLAVETGYVGLGAYAVLLFTLLVITLRRAWRSRKTAGARQEAALAGLTIAFIVISSFDNVLQATAVMWAFWVLLAAVMNTKPEDQTSET